MTNCERIFHIDLPVRILLILPLDQHLACDFLENGLIFRGEETFPIPCLTFGQEGSDSFISFRLPLLIGVGLHFGFDLLLQRTVNLFHTKEFPQACHFFKGAFKQIFIAQAKIIFAK